MKLIAAEIAIALLETIECDAKLLVGICETNHRLDKTASSEFDLKFANNNLESIRRKIQIIKDESYIGSEFYSKEIA